MKSEVLNFVLYTGTSFGLHTITIKSLTIDLTNTTLNFRVVDERDNEIISLNPIGVLEDNSIKFDIEIKNKDLTKNLPIGVFTTVLEWTYNNGYTRKKYGTFVIKKGY